MLISDFVSFDAVSIAEKSQERLTGLMNDDCLRTRKMVLQTLEAFFNFLRGKLDNSAFEEKFLLGVISGLEERLGIFTTRLICVIQ